MKEAARKSQVLKREKNKSRKRVKSPKRKLCGGCKQIKIRTYFTPSKQNNDGLHAWCRECMAKWAKKKRSSNLEAARKKDIEYRKRNLEKLRKRERILYRQSVKDKTAWYIKNPEAVKAHSHKRRARKVGAEGSFTKEDVKNIMRAQDYLCAICSVYLIKYHIDHIVPLSKGGSNWPENLQMTCATCNLSKGAKLQI